VIQVAAVPILMVQIVQTVQRVLMILILMETIVVATQHQTQLMTVRLVPPPPQVTKINIMMGKKVDLVDHLLYLVREMPNTLGWQYSEA
jgi:hypothetical protein